MILEELIRTYYFDTLPNKRRSHDSIMFELHAERNIWRLLNDINNHSFQASAYAFLVTHPVIREVFAGDMGMRITQHYIEKRIRPLIEGELIDSTFNNRIGKGSNAAVNNLISDIYEVSKGFTKTECWVMKVDMKGYFPNADQTIAYSQLESLVLNGYEGEDIYDLLYLLRANIFSYPTHHCTRKTPVCEWAVVPSDKSLFTKDDGIGGVIGHLIWQCAMTYYLNDICHWLTEECGLKISVYMDDIAIVTNNKESTLALIPELRRRLSEIGVTLHPRKFYCQHYSKGVEFVGKHIKMNRVYTNNRCKRNAFRKIDYYNKRVGVRRLDRFVATVNSYLGQFKSVNGYNIVCKIKERIDERWWNYIEFDEDRICIRPLKEYTLKNRIIKQFNLHDYGRKRKTRNGNGKGKNKNSIPKEFSGIKRLSDYPRNAGRRTDECRNKAEMR